MQVCCLPHNSLRRLSFRQAEFILPVHDYTFFGAQYRPCTLVPSGFGLPLPGLPADFTTELAANLYSGGTCTHWVTISNFTSYGDSQRLGFRWARELARLGRCHICYFQLVPFDNSNRFHSGNPPSLMIRLITRAVIFADSVTTSSAGFLP